MARSSSSTTLAGRTGDDCHLNIGPELMSRDYLSLRKYRVLRLSPATLFGRAELPCRLPCIRVPCMRAVYEGRVERTAVHKGRARETAVSSSCSTT